MALLVVVAAALAGPSPVDDSLPHLMQRGGAECMSDADCNLCGVCAAAAAAAGARRQCRCDKGWTGPSCGVLRVGPVPTDAKAAAYSGIIWPTDRNSTSWGGSVVPGPGGSHELFVSSIADRCGMAAWQANSEILHATAPSLGGPYAQSDVVLGPFAHNANPLRLSQAPHKGDYAVFHVGSGPSGGSGHGGGRRLDCTNGTTPAKPPDSHRQLTQIGESKTCKPTENQSLPLSKTLRVPHAASPRGPWSFEPQTCVGPALDPGPAGCPHFSNAAPLILANGTTLIVHSGCPGYQQHGLNLAIAPQWTGPYRPAKGVNADGVNAWYTPSILTVTKTHPGGCTDPFLWMDLRGHYHALFHCHWTTGDQGGHAYSKDGRSWTTSTVRPFTERVALDDGTSITYSARQRPHLVLEGGLPGVSPSGSPVALVTGLKIWNADPRGQLPWMRDCAQAMQPLCDKAGTHLQPIVSEPSMKLDDAAGWLGAGCNYTRRRGVSFHGGPGALWNHNVIACMDSEGLESCRSRCDNDKYCASFALYVRGPETGRCCTKRNCDEAKPWAAGDSFTKQPNRSCPFVPSPPPPAPVPVPPAPPSAPVDVQVIWRGNATFPYNKGAMVVALPGGRMAAATQAGMNEGTPDMRILYAVSQDGKTWPAEWSAAVPEPTGQPQWAQWQPVLFLAPSGVLWLFYSAGPDSANPNLLFASTTDQASGFTEWAPRRLILNASQQEGERRVIWPINRVVISPVDGAWLLPCDYGCGHAPTGTFMVRSESHGAKWRADDPVPGILTHNICPEPAVVAVNRTTMLALIRSTKPGFLQSFSHDGGRHWTPAVASAVDGAAAKPALAAYRTAAGGRGLVLAWNVVTRERMALSTSLDGVQWSYYATLDNGSAAAHPTESADFYPTTIVDDHEIVTVWSSYAYHGSGYGHIMLGRTPLPAKSDDRLMGDHAPPSPPLLLPAPFPPSNGGWFDREKKVPPAAGIQPHIAFIILDDWGWADAGWVTW